MDAQPCPTLAEVINAKQLTREDLIKEYNKLKKYDASAIRNCFAGNPILYHFQLENLVNVKTKSGSFAETMSDVARRSKIWADANKYANGSRPNNPAMRLFEMWRRMNGAVVFFKPNVAMYIYKKFKATKVLDVCAGWGGRLLGATALGIEYTGIDTNTDLRQAYDGIIQLAGGGRMIWDDAMNVDFETLDYDCVLTSPPYINLEIYPHMNVWENKKQFYETFLIPLIDKCRLHIRRGGRVCFNISPKMYDELIKAGYEECRESIDMKQQKVQGKDKGDKVYVW